MKKKGEYDIVMIGASAGGLEAITQLLQHMRSNTGMSFFYIQHISHDQDSALSSILSKVTRMKVQEVQHDMHIEPNNLYINAPGREMQLKNRVIHLTEHLSHSQMHPIDAFFNSVAALPDCKAISVILSGNANDGSTGTVNIKNAGGITFAQNDSAKFGSMPRSAIATGKVDFVLSAKEIGRELSTLGKKPLLKNHHPLTSKIRSIQNDDPDLAIILALIQKEAGIDFSYYKMAIIIRRIERRMLLHSLTDIKDYSALLLHKKEEINILSKDLLINVTDFFRDTDTHEYLKKNLFPKLLAAKAKGQTLRIWIPACSTGEEAYSIAMNLLELIDGRELNISIQIFASDLSAKAIAKARTGEYTSQQVSSVSQKRLQRFYVKTGMTYQVNKNVRDICIFAIHNILNDPPFSHVDFISCCNMLIYMNTAAQKKILNTFHYALNEGGYLILGKSETIGSAGNLFLQISKELKIYIKKETGQRTFPAPISGLKSKIITSKIIDPGFPETKAYPATSFSNEVDAILLSRYIPASVVINAQMDILQFRGASELFLKHTPGKANLHLLKMSPPELTAELRSGVANVVKTGEDFRKENIGIKAGKIFRHINIEIVPLIMQPGEPLLLVVFTESKTKGITLSGEPGKNNNGHNSQWVKELEASLALAHSNMQIYAQEQETFIEELQSATEEVVSSNEELQSVNEELATSKEEIESTNEELISMNQELQTRNELLNESYEYSEAIIKTMHESILILDRDLIIKSANQSFYKNFSTNEKETIGTFMYDLANKQWGIPELRTLLQNIISYNTIIKDFEISADFNGLGEKVVLLNARIVQRGQGGQLILLAIKDITDRAVLERQEKEKFASTIQETKVENKKLENAVAERTRQLVDTNKLLAQNVTELEKINEELQAFAFVSSHDLQEPLRKIQILTTMILQTDHQNLSESGKDYFNRIANSAKRMRSLIMDLIAYTKVNVSDQQFEMTDLAVIIEEVKKELEETIQEKGAEIEVDVQGPVRVIPFQFRQLFHNLLTNALKFSKSGRKPYISIISRFEKTTLLNINKNDPTKVNCCIITISDNGIGFAKKHAAKIFTVFQKLHSKDEYEGTGIGLAIVKKIVLNHNGMINAESTPGKKTRFTILLPV